MPGPYAQLVRGTGMGDVLYTNSTVALDADTGELKWYFQHLPRDNWDLDSPFERVLVDDGDKHMLITVAGKNGIAWALDRDTGKYLWHKETVFQNVVTNVDADGKVTINDVRGYTVEAAQRELEDLELQVSTQEDTSCAGSSPPTVATQSLAPGDVPIHSPIVLGYCSGS